MAKSTGPILLTGAASFLNKWIGNNQGIDFKIPVATAIAAGALALLEEASPELAVGIAWISFITLLLVAPKSGASPISNITRLTGL